MTQTRRRASRLFAASLWLFAAEVDAAPPSASPPPRPENCPEPAPSAAHLAPASADFAGGGRIESLEDDEVGRGLLQIAALDLQLDDWMELRRACLAGAEVQLEHASAAGSANGQWVWLLRGPGVGSDASIACVSDHLRRRERGREPWQSKPDEIAGGCIRTYQGDGRRAIAPDPDTLVLVPFGPDTWGDRVLGAVAAPVARGAAVDLLEAVPTAPEAESGLWFAGTFHRPDRFLDAVPWRKTLRWFTARLEADRRLTLEIEIATTDFGSALIAFVRDATPLMTERLVELGAPSNVLSKLGVALAGKLVVLRWSADAGELRRLHGQLSDGLRGGGFF